MTLTKPKEELLYSEMVSVWYVSCDTSSRETFEITLFYRAGHLVKISWKSLDISSNDMSGCRFWVDFQEKFAFNWAKCYSNHCNYRREKRVEHFIIIARAPCCKPAACWSLYGSVRAVRMVTVCVSHVRGVGCHLSPSPSATLMDHRDNLGCWFYLVSQSCYFWPQV